MNSHCRGAGQGRGVLDEWARTQEERMEREGDGGDQLIRNSLDNKGALLGLVQA